MEKLQRFSIRKLSIGAVSCIIGTVSFLGYSHKVQAAETPQTVETAKAENEIQLEKTQESKPSEEAKGGTQNAVVDKNTGKSQETGAVTAVNQASPKENASTANEAAKANEAAVINKAETNNLNGEGNETGSVDTTVFKTDTASKEAKQNIADLAISTKMKLQAIRLAKPVDVDNAAVLNTLDQNKSKTNASSKLVQTVSPEQPAAPTTPVTNKASHESNSQAQPSSSIDNTQTKLVRRPVMRLAATAVTNSDELIVGKDVTISDFSVTAAKGKNEFENSHANIKFTMHADNPSAIVGKRLTIQVDKKVWGGFYSSEQHGSNPATISYQGQVIGTLNYGYPFNFVYITFDNHVKDYTSINLQSDLVMAGNSQNDSLYQTDLYTPTQAKDGQTYHLTNDIVIGQQKYSSNLPSTIHYRKLGSESVSSVTDVTTTSYAQGDSKLYAGMFYKTPDGIYYSQSSDYSGNNLYGTKSGQPGYLEEPDLYVGTDIITDHTQSYTATIDIDQTKLSLDYYSKTKPIASYYLNKNYWDDKNLLPNTSDVYIDYSHTYSSTATADATVTKNSVIFNKLNGQSLSTRRFNIDDPTYHMSLGRYTNYINQNGKLYLTPALFKQLQAVAESDQNLTEAINTVKTTGRNAEIKLAKPINTGLKATIKTSDGKTKEVSLLIDTIDYEITTASTAPKGSILVSAQGKTAKVYHPGDQNIPAVVDQNKLTKTITRTINVHEPGEKVTTIKQDVVMTQSVSVVDGKDVTYNGDWKVQGDSQWASYDVPSVSGYTASQSHVVQQAVTDTTKDQTVDITYTANDHQISVEYVDNATGQVLKTDHVSGKTGQTVSITPHVPDGWELVSGQSVPSEVILGADGAPATVIKVQPQERSVAVKFVDDQYFKQQVGQVVTVTGRDGDTVNLKLIVPDKYQLADGQQLPTTYTFAKGSGDLTIHLVHKVVQREATINVQLGLMTFVNFGNNSYEPVVVTQARWKQLEEEEAKNGPVLPGGEVPFTEVGTLTGHVGYDLVDEEAVSFGDDWTSLNLGSRTYQLPNGTDVVNGIMIDSNVTMGKKLKEYYLDEYHNWDSNKHVDPDYANRPWHGYLSVNATNNTQTPGSEDIIRLGLQAGLAGNESNILAKATGDRAATAVEMANKTIDVNWLQDHLDFGARDFSEQDGQLKAKTGWLAFGVYIPYVEKTATRTINVTTPDGKTTTVKQTATLAKQVDFSKDAHPDWTTSEWASYDVPAIPGYTASQSQVAKDTVTGETKDQIVNITYTANPQTTTVVYQAEDGTLVHTITVNGQTGQTVKVSSEVPVGWKVINGNVPSEITFGPDGAPQTVVTIAHQHVTVTSDAPKTTSDKLPDNPSKAYPVGVGENDLNKTVTRTIKVTTPDGQTKIFEQTAKLTRTADVDEVTGKVKYSNWTTDEWTNYVAPSVPGYTASQPNIAKEAVTDTTKDQIVNITYTANDGTQTIVYQDEDGSEVDKQVVPGKTDEKVKVTPDVPDGYVLKGEVPSEVTIKPDDTPITVTVEHGKSHVTPDKPVNKGDLIPDTKDKHYPEGLTHNDLNKTVTREITIIDPTGKKSITIQTVTFTRGATVDEVTNKVTYDDWSENGKHTFDKVDVPIVQGYTASGDVPSLTVTPDSQLTNVTVIYNANEQSTTITYVDDMTNKILASDSQDGKFDHEIAFSHKPSDVISGFEKAGYKLVSNNFKDGTKYKADDKQNEFIVHLTHDKQNVSRQDQVIETIHYVYENGRNAQPDHEQTISFIEDGVKDKVTGQIDWTPAKPQKFDDVATPAIVGYTPDKDDVTGSTVNFGDKDIEVTVTYHNNAQKAVITYVDDTEKKTLGSDSQDGKFNQVITFEHDPAEVINSLKEKGYKLVSNDFNSNKYQADNSKNVFYVHLKHGTHVISDNDSITETITYKMSDGSKAPDKVEKQVEFSRDGYNDEVTKQDHWNKWQPNRQSFSAVPTPEVKGYTPDIKLVEAKTVAAGDKDIAVTITYSPDQQKAKVVFIDDTTKKILDTHDLIGVTNGHEKYNPSEEIEKFIHDNYVFVSSDYPEKGFTYDNDDSKDQVFEVHLKERPTESNIPAVPNNTEDNGGSNDTPTVFDEPEKDNSGSDTVGESSHKTPVKRNSNKKHHSTKKINNQKNTNKKHQGTKMTNNQKTSKTTKLNPNEVDTKANKPVQTKLGKVQEPTNDTLPQTGNKQSGLMAALGLAISSLGMIGAVKSKKRKDNQ